MARSIITTSLLDRGCPTTSLVKGSTASTVIFPDDVLVLSATRITEAGDRRITEAGDARITEGTV